jgi:hypothetical protein
VALPDPAGDENKTRPSAKQQPSGQDKKVSARETTGLSHVERAEAEICAANNEYRAKEYAHWNRQTFWQRWVTIFTGLAFAAAAYYACQAKIQSGVLTQTFHFANRAYTGVDIPADNDWTNGSVFLQVTNTGHLPASEITIIVYSARETSPFKRASGRCRILWHNKLGISPGDSARVPIPLPNWQRSEYDAIKNNTEALFLGMDITYNDGFSEDGLNHSFWCSQTKTLSGKLIWAICPDGQLEWLRTATANQPACQ